MNSRGFRGGSSCSQVFHDLRMESRQDFRVVPRVRECSSMFLIVFEGVRQVTLTFQGFRGAASHV